MTSRAASSTSAMMSIHKSAQEPLASAHGHAWRIPFGIEVVGSPAKLGGAGGPVWTPAPHPIAPGTRARGGARLPSSFRVAIIGSQRRSAVPRARLHTGPAAAPVPRCVVVRLTFHAFARLPVQHRSPSAQRRGEALGDCGVDTAAAEAQTPGQPQHQIGTFTTIDGLFRRTAE